MGNPPSEIQSNVDDLYDPMWLVPDHLPSLSAGHNSLTRCMNTEILSAMYGADRARLDYFGVLFLSAVSRNSIVVPRLKTQAYTKRAVTSGSHPILGTRTPWYCEVVRARRVGGGSNTAVMA